MVKLVLTDFSQTLSNFCDEFSISITFNFCDTSQFQDVAGLSCSVKAVLIIFAKFTRKDMCRGYVTF